jgi:glycoside/pentoside/hexuronide:cation symporter, GPH family
MDYDQRTSLTMWRMLIGMIASVVGVFGHSFLITFLPTVDFHGFTLSDTQAYSVSIGVWSIVLVICIWTTVFTVREIFSASLLSNHSSSIMAFLKETKSALANRAFLSVVVYYATSWVGLNFLQANLQIYNKYVLQLNNLFALWTLLIQGLAVVSLVFWQYVSKWLGKKVTAYLGGLILIPCMVVFGIMPVNSPVLSGIMFALGGLGVGNMLLMPWAMLPDVMELDELKCGYRREGIFYSWFVFFQKIGLGLSLGFSSLALGWAGYIPPDSQTSVEDPQPYSVIIALRLMVSAIPGVLLVISMVSVWLFPITRASHAEIIDQVMVKRQHSLSSTETDTSLEEIPESESESVPNVHKESHSLPDEST